MTKKFISIVGIFFIIYTFNSYSFALPPKEKDCEHMAHTIPGWPFFKWDPAKMPVTYSMKGGTEENRQHLRNAAKEWADAIAHCSYVTIKETTGHANIVAVWSARLSNVEGYPYPNGDKYHYKIELSPSYNKVVYLTEFGHALGIGYNRTCGNLFSPLHCLAREVTETDAKCFCYFNPCSGEDCAINAKEGEGEEEGEEEEGEGEGEGEGERESEGEGEREGIKLTGEYSISKLITFNNFGPCLCCSIPLIFFFFLFSLLCLKKER
jgi:hypothetical protein